MQKLSNLLILNKDKGISDANTVFRLPEFPEWAISHRLQTTDMKQMLKPST